MSTTRIRTATLALAAALSCVAGAGAAEIPMSSLGHEIGLNADASEVARFTALRDRLSQSRDAQLQDLGSLAARMLQAIASHDADGFVTARALFELRAGSLSPRTGAVLGELRDSTAAAAPAPDISITSGCGSELSCNYGAAISCSCTGSSSCTASPNVTTGGSISCNCPGTANDRSKACPSAPAVCVPDCNTQCAPDGGVCLASGTCACF